VGTPKKKITIVTFDKIGNRGSPMTIINGLKAYAETTHNCIPYVGGRYVVKLRYMDREKGFMIFTPIEEVPPAPQQKTTHP